ncbi:MAG TPA: hypothetical protein VF624_09355, partial [Tepidisphaeraceae bacterium]
MPDAIDHRLARTIRRARRRLWAARAADALFMGGWLSIGVGLLGAGAAWGMNLPMIWAWAAVAACLAVAGAWAITRRPTPVAAAAWLDDAGGLNDLLSTALLARGDDAFVAVVRRQASAACAALPAPPWPGRLGVRTHVATLLLAAAAGILALSAPPSPAANAASASPLPGDPSSGAVAQTLVRTPAGVERAPLSPRADPTSADRAAGSARPAADRTADRPGGGIGRADAPATPVIRDLQDQRRASDPVTDSSPPTAPPIHAAAGRPADLTRPGPSDPAA